MATEDSNKSEKNGKSDGGKWWEFYVVRYALGTVFGVLIVNFLVKNGLAIPFPVGDIAQITKAEGIPLLLGYGLVYCYLASAPILVFHATRASLRDRCDLAKRVTWVISIALSILWMCIAVPGVTSKALYVAGTVAIFLISFLLCSQLRAVSYGFKRTDEIWRFYRKLDTNRRVHENRELIDSYRHLREHGNAFFVVVLELALALCLYVAGKVSLFPPGVLPDCKGDTACLLNSPDGFLQSVIVVLIWILPAASVWTIGCFLEAEFACDASLGQAASVGTAAHPAQQPNQSTQPVATSAGP